MKASLIPALVVVALATSGVKAGCPVYIPQAPNTCTAPAYYAVNCNGGTYGPNYCLRPPFPPFQGMVFPPNHAVSGVKSAYSQGVRMAPQGYPGGGHHQGGYPQAGYPQGQGGYGGPPTFVTHPYSRSPRDFFMVYE
jgi:hypothetical protein